MGFLFIAFLGYWSYSFLDSFIFSFLFAFFDWCTFPKIFIEDAWENWAHTCQSLYMSEIVYFVLGCFGFLFLFLFFLVVGREGLLLQPACEILGPLPGIKQSLNPLEHWGSATLMLFYLWFPSVVKVRIIIPIFLEGKLKQWKVKCLALKQRAPGAEARVELHFSDS